jgi:hypothetical protein
MMFPTEGGNGSPNAGRSSPETPRRPLFAAGSVQLSPSASGLAIAMLQPAGNFFYELDQYRVHRSY